MGYALIVENVNILKFEEQKCSWGKKEKINNLIVLGIRMGKKKDIPVILDNPGCLVSLLFWLAHIQKWWMGSLEYGLEYPTSKNTH